MAAFYTKHKMANKIQLGSSQRSDEFVDELVLDGCGGFPLGHVVPHSSRLLRGVRQRLLPQEPERVQHLAHHAQRGDIRGGRRLRGGHTQQRGGQVQALGVALALVPRPEVQVLVLDVVQVVHQPRGEVRHQQRTITPELAAADHVRAPGLTGRRGRQRLLGGGEPVETARLARVAPHGKLEPQRQLLHLLGRLVLLHERHFIPAVDAHARQHHRALQVGTRARQERLR
mmetsp:Transcript_43106/g.69322  ORF Transcript_43106/g.69322 Transcript_43106/m.69322 type:complete len:229 (+) Transcript_43106:1182-1868(+)